MNTEILDKIKQLLEESEAAPCERVFDHPEPYTGEIGHLRRVDPKCDVWEMLTAYNCKTLPVNGKALELIELLINHADAMVELCELALHVKEQVTQPIEP